MRPARKVRIALPSYAIVKRAKKISSVGTLRAVWIASIAWYEFGVFFWSVAQCAWPDQELVYAGEVGRAEPSRHATHVLLVADPQVLDGSSYPERGFLLGLLTQVIVDLNMRKSWSAVRRLLLRRNHESAGDRDAVVFLGDMMDNGRNAYSDIEYQAYLNRFKSIFSLDPSVGTYYIPGNHDVGLGAAKSFSPLARSRYSKHFGPLNYKVSLANHTLVMLNAPGLVEEDYRRASAGLSFKKWKPRPSGVINFVNEFASVGTEDPVVLFSHIPLFRPDTASCGPLRERGSIRRGVGFGYQNTLGRQTSEYILKNIQPDIIFSGDDHDYCEYIHKIPLLSDEPEPKIRYTREVTVKSFSIAMGISNPGFQLLSLADPATLSSGTPSYADALCILPDQIAIYLYRYLPLFLLSLFFLAVSTLRRLTDRTKYGGAYNLDIDPNDVSLLQSSPELDLPGTRRIPNSTSLVNGGLAPTYRAASASFAATPNTPEFTVTLDGRFATPGLLGAPPAGLGAVPNDVEQGFFQHADDDDDEQVQYADRQTQGGAFYTPSLPRTPQRKRHFTWSWTFVLGGRRRRLTIGVPPVLEQTTTRIAHFCRREDANKRPLGTRGASKGSRHASRHENAVLVFMDGLARMAWPAVLLFVLINLYMFR